MIRKVPFKKVKTTPANTFHKQMKQANNATHKIKTKPTDKRLQSKKKRRH